MPEPIVFLFGLVMVVLAFWAFVQAAKFVAVRVLPPSRNGATTPHQPAPLVVARGGSVVPPLAPPATKVVASTPSVVAPMVAQGATIFEAMVAPKPHLLIVGYTGGGKSVLLRALVKYLVAQGASVVAIDPDSAPKHYPAATHLINDDEQWGAAVLAIAALFDAREEAKQGGQETFAPLWVVVDECQELLAVDGVVEHVNRLIRRGRKFNMHLVLAVQDSQVKTLGIEGQSSLLINLARIEVRKEEVNGVVARYALVEGKRYEVPNLPETYDGAKGKVLDLDIPVLPKATAAYTEKHLLAVKVLTQEPTIGVNAFTLALYGRTDGNCYYLAKGIREQVEAALKGGGDDLL